MAKWLVLWEERNKHTNTWDARQREVEAKTEDEALDLVLGGYEDSDLYNNNRFVEVIPILESED